jgi:proton-translocating NADH-quinone oxidoreductase chain M
MVRVFVCGTRDVGFKSLHSPSNLEKMLSRRIRRPLRGGRLRRRIDVKESLRRGRWITTRTWRRSVGRWLSFDRSQSGYQRVEEYHGRRPLGVKRSRGVDGISRCFVRLTTRRTPRCRRASSQGISKQERGYYGGFVLREGRIRSVFLVTDVRWFYIAFEAVLIPMYRMIGIWGSRARKVRAAYLFFRYTLGGSVRILIGVRYLRQRYGTTDMETLKYRCQRGVEEGGLEEGSMRRRWRGFYASLAVKVPMVPVHVWLPEAHVEAPTGGSVILAGILLKMGTYGMMRLLMGRRPRATVYYTPRVYLMAVIGMIYPARTARRQTDRKRIIAYASVSHLNITLIGRFSRTEQGVEGGLLQMISHGLVAGARFIGIGVRYDRYHTRRLMYYGGVATTMPRFSRVFRVFTIANIGLPGTSAFVGEWRIRVGIVQKNRRVTRRSARGMVLGAAYSLWLYNRVVYGNRKRGYRGVSSEQIEDRTRREGRMFAPLRRRTVWLGLDPSIILDTVHVSCVSRVEGLRSV